MGSVVDHKVVEQRRKGSGAAATAQGAATRLEEPDFSSSKWYFTREDIDNLSPSRKDGIDARKEAQYRNSYCCYLQDLGMTLKMPQITIATAIVFCHRFFMRQSHARNDRLTVATVSMFLSGKVEETPRPAKDVVCVAYMLRYKKKISVSSNTCAQQLSLLLSGEKFLLETLGFDLNVSHPYRPMVLAVKKLDASLQGDVAQVAWNFINDGLKSTLFLQFKPHVIAAGAIFLAGKFMKKKLAGDNDKAWWRAFHVTPRQLEEVSNQMLEQYEQPGTVAARAAARPATGGTDTPPSGQVSTQTEAHDAARDDVSKKAVSSPGEVVSGKEPEPAVVEKKEGLNAIDEAKLKAALEKRRKSRAAAPPKQAVVTDEELLERELENGIEVARQEKPRTEAGDKHRASHKQGQGQGPSLKRQRTEEVTAVKRDGLSVVNRDEKKNPEELVAKEERRNEVVSEVAKSDSIRCDGVVAKTEALEVVVPEGKLQDEEAVSQTDEDVTKKNRPEDVKSTAPPAETKTEKQETAKPELVEEKKKGSDGAAGDSVVVAKQEDVVAKQEDVVRRPEGDTEADAASKECKKETAEQDGAKTELTEEAKSEVTDVKSEPPETTVAAAKRNEKRERPAKQDAGAEPANKRKKLNEAVPSKPVQQEQKKEQQLVQERKSKREQEPNKQGQKEQQLQEPKKEQQQVQEPKREEREPKKEPPQVQDQEQEEEEGELPASAQDFPRSPPRPVSCERRMLSPHDRLRPPPPPPSPFVPYDSRYDRRRDYQPYPRREPFFDRHQHQHQHQPTAGFRHHRGDYYAPHHHFPPPQPQQQQQHYYHHQQPPRDMDWHQHHRLLPPPPPQPQPQPWIDRDSKRARYDSYSSK